MTKTAKRSVKRMRADALAIFKAALKAADAGQATKQALSIQKKRGQPGLFTAKHWFPFSAYDRIFVISVGKAAVAMAHAAGQSLGARRIDGGLVVTKYGHAKKPRLSRLTVRESAHPVPDQAGVDAASEIESLARSLTARDLLLVLVSGGASALLPSPAHGLTLHDKQKTTGLLLRAGADIVELNAVRKHLSTLKGGQLAMLAQPATVVCLAMSDVIADRLDVIGSGLCFPDSSTFDEALAVLDRYALTDRVPRSVRTHLQSGAQGDTAETPKPGDARFKNVYNAIVGSNNMALNAAANEALRRSYKPLILSSTMQGETREVARVHAQILRECINSQRPQHTPVCLLSGGETTVSVRGSGKGGRNQEFALACAFDLASIGAGVALSAGTDGTDGPTDAAGAIADFSTITRAAALRLDPAAILKDNDSYRLFHALDDLIITGPTGTNVMDIHLLLGA